MLAWMCTGTGGCGDVIALVVLAAIVLAVVVVAVGFWMWTRFPRRAGSPRSPSPDGHRDAAGDRT